MLRNVLSRAIFLTLVCALLTSNASAVPSVLTHQGRLLDASDTPLNGVYTIIYSIHDAPVGGTQLWMEDHVGVVVTDGLFTVELGSIIPLGVDIIAGSGGGGGGGSARYLQVQLSGQPPIMPRTQLVSAPFSLATERVSGDFHSGPGIIVIGDTTSNSYATFGEKVAGGLHAAGSALSQGGSLLTQDCDDDDAEFMMRHSQGSNVGILRLHTNLDSLSITSSYVDPTVETGMMHSSTTDGSSISMSTIDNTPNRISMNVTTPKLGSRLRLDTDLGNDGVEDNSVLMSADLTSSRVAIKTKGTGADKNRSAGSSTDDTLTIHYVDMDDDDDGVSEASAVSAVSSLAGAGSGAAAASYARWAVDSDDDGIPEGEIRQIATPTTCGVAINTKGTGAEKGRVALHTSSGGGGLGPEMSMVLEHDSDGDTVPESEISNVVVPGSCSVAIKTKGTGADKNRTAGSSTDDTLTIHYADMDDDGDGVSEAKAVSGVSNLAGGGGGMASASYARWIVDSDDDGVPEGDISQTVTPTTCGVAIKTKGTGAEANRSALLSSTTEVGEILTVSTIDDDGDGLSESSISQRIAPTTSSLAIKTKGTSAQRTQTISGDCDDESSVLSLDTDDDGDGISDSKVVVASGASLLGGALPGGAIISSRYDSDDDGVAEQEIDQIVTPTTCSVAIKTKGTGADKNRVIGSTDDTTATMLMATDSASISMRVRRGGVIKGAININHGSALRVGFDSDGNGYLSNSIGIGVDPTHHIDVVGGAYCDGTNWVNASDKNSKENFEKVDGEEILEKISDLEITKWNYKGDEDAQHIGPTAQDFKKTFGVGADDKSISTIDPSGIALAAIKELYTQLKQKDQQLDEQQKLILELQEKLTKIEKQLKKQ